MFSNFPSLFDKNFVIGFLLPVLLGLIAFSWLFPHLPILAPIHSLQAKDDELAKLTYLGLLSYGSAVFLWIFNDIQLRLMQGYIWPVSRAPFLVARQAAARDALLAEYQPLIARWSKEREAFPPEDQRRASRLRRELGARFPPEGIALLPTSFGNVIRAAESYALTAYGVDGPPMWQRLKAVIPAAFNNDLEEAKAQLNCLVNLIFVLTAFALAALAVAFQATPWRLVLQATEQGLLLTWRPSGAFLAGAAATALIPAAYRFAISRAAARGEVVKAAFDCYLPALIKQLGYDPPPTEAERRAFWTDVNALITYRQPFDQGRWTFADAKAEHRRTFVENLRDLLG